MVLLFFMVINCFSETSDRDRWFKFSKLDQMLYVYDIFLAIEYSWYFYTLGPFNNGVIEYDIFDKIIDEMDKFKNEHFDYEFIKNVSDLITDEYSKSEIGTLPYIAMNAIMKQAFKVQKEQQERGTL
jgi:hypothetical protein